MPFTIFGQEPDCIKITLRDGSTDYHIYRLQAGERSALLDSTELLTIKPEWIKSITISHIVEDSAQDLRMANSSSPVTVLIELKKRHLRKYFKNRQRDDH